MLRNQSLAITRERQEYHSTHGSESFPFIAVQTHQAQRACRMVFFTGTTTIHPSAWSFSPLCRSEQLKGCHNCHFLGGRTAAPEVWIAEGDICYVCARLNLTLPLYSTRFRCHALQWFSDLRTSPRPLRLPPFTYLIHYAFY